jgi:hypothetical protein
MFSFCILRKNATFKSIRGTFYNDRKTIGYFQALIFHTFKRKYLKLMGITQY